MAERTSKPVTQLLDAAGRGDSAAQERLWLLVYDELHRVAKRQNVNERVGHSLQTTALVNEAYLRLIGDGDVQWANRRHFFAAAAKAMRRIRIDHARKRDRLKRGGGTKARRHEGTEDLCEPAVFDQDPSEALAIDEDISTPQDEAYIERTFKILSGIQRKRGRKEGRRKKGERRREKGGREGKRRSLIR